MSLLTQYRTSRAPNPAAPGNGAMTVWWLCRVGLVPQDGESIPVSSLSHDQSRLVCDAREMINS